MVVAPTPTPFTDAGEVDLDAMARNIERWLQTPLSGFVLGTANGEENALSDLEKIDIVKTVHEARNGERMVIAGIDLLSSVEVTGLAERYAAAGADLIRVRIPRGLQPDEVRVFYAEVTSGSPLPVIVIHQTFDTGPGAPPEVIGEVCGLDNVFGYITDHDIRFEGWVSAAFPEGKHFWICNGGLLAYGSLMGANGACMWLGNIAPELCMDIIAAGQRGDFAEARRLQSTASMLDRRIGEFGLRGVKAALSFLGFTMTGPRAPAPSATAVEVKQVASALREGELID
jgi:dihydrodipicolinate synthase/N-acetylneuraminate lyase